MTFNEIINDPNYHFENCFITNFDLIHNECRGDKLTHSRKYYETLFNKKIKDEILSENDQNRFISSAIKVEQKDLNIEKSVFKDHFNRKTIEEKLEKKGAFLSSMKKRKNLKTDDCKSLFFKEK